ncbi:MAG: MBOAT family O-acyltransferase [Bacillota bacterium]|nr:MBOAT family O-acyltransferase [Bacillota bacterium]
MVFSSLIFIFFFLPLILIVYFIEPKRFRNITLIIFSLFFYAWGEPVFVLIMLFATVFDYTAGYLIGVEKEKGHTGKGFLIASLTMNLTLLGFFKYSDFIISSINGIFHTGIPLLHLPLPIGISFYTFQTMSYTIDVYRGRVKAQKNFMHLLLYTTLFPELVAGPIVRYQTVEKEIYDRKVTWEGFSEGVIRFVIGLGKKILIANQLAVVADGIFALPAGDMAVLTAWIGIIAYTFQIYFDFSGYSDMAIGLGHMFGFHFDENFRYPYISCSVTEFWRRWHISLGTWFKDYVYFPLGGSRVDKQWKLFRNLFIVWALTGLWHGASWNFVAWGLYYLVFLVLEKMVFHSGKPKHYSLPRNIIVMVIVIVGWVLFRSANFTYAAEYIKNMFGFAHMPLIDYNTGYYFYDKAKEFALAAVCSIPIVPFIRGAYEKTEKKLPRVSMDTAQFAFIIVIFFFSIINLLNQSYNPFIYFRF